MTPGLGKTFDFFAGRRSVLSGRASFGANAGQLRAMNLVGRGRLAAQPWDRESETQWRCASLAVAAYYTSRIVRCVTHAATFICNTPPDHAGCYP